MNMRVIIGSTPSPFEGGGLPARTTEVIRSGGGRGLRKHCPYIADFYCAEKKLILEVDGGIHALQTSYDQTRDAYMRTNGYVVVRVSNRFVKEWLPEALENIGRAVGIEYGE